MRARSPSGRAPLGRPRSPLGGRRARGSCSRTGSAPAARRATRSGRSAGSQSVALYIARRDPEQCDATPVAHLIEHLADRGYAAGHLEPDVETLLHPELVLDIGQVLL